MDATAEQPVMATVSNCYLLLVIFIFVPAAISSVTASSYGRNDVQLPAL